jgi:hypothetical protein
MPFIFIWSFGKWKSHNNNRNFDYYTKGINVVNKFTTFYVFTQFIQTFRWQNIKSRLRLTFVENFIYFFVEKVQVNDVVFSSICDVENFMNKKLKIVNNKCS